MSSESEQDGTSGPEGPSSRRQPTSNGQTAFLQRAPHWLIIFLKRVGILPARRGHFRNVGRIVLLAGLVGLVAGLGAVAFQYLSHAVVRFGLEAVAGFEHGRPAGEAALFAAGQPLVGHFSPLLLLAIMALGGLVSGFLVYRIAPEAEGHGTDAAIRAYHHNNGVIRARVPLVKLFASAITLGTGGSGGREGPIAQIGAGFGSFLATRLRLSDYERRLLLAAGMGAGVAAIFRAPLAGAIFAAEVLYRDADFEAEAMIPSFIASTTAYCVYGLFMQNLLGIPGFRHMFDIIPGLRFNSPALLGPLGVMALVVAAASVLYVRTFYGIHNFFKRLKVPPSFRPAIGALAAGAFAVLLYYGVRFFGDNASRASLNVLSYGYGVLQDVFDPHKSGIIPEEGLAPAAAMAAAAVLLLIGLGKILTTSLTIGSGGSGGVFGPSMVIGGTLGGASGLVFHALAPALVTPPQVVVFAILGMAGFFSAAAKTPISTIIIVSELTGGYELLVPAMWVSALAYLLSGRRSTIYREQVPSRLASPAHQNELIVDVLKGLSVGDAGLKPRTDFVTIPAGTSLEAITGMLPGTTQTVFPVIDRDGKFCGVFDLADVRKFLYREQAGQIIIALDLMAEGVEPLKADTDLSAVMARFARLKYDELPVVDATGAKITGMLSRKDVITVYEKRLLRGRRNGA